MGFSTLDCKVRQDLSFIAGRRALVQKNIKRRCICVQLSAEAVEPAFAVSCHRCFVEDITCNNQFTTRASRVGERDCGIVFIQDCQSGIKVLPLTGRYPGISVTNRKNNH